jgi:hypothetical protein
MWGNKRIARSRVVSGWRSPLALGDVFIPRPHTLAALAIPSPHDVEAACNVAVAVVATARQGAERGARASKSVAVAPHIVHSAVVHVSRCCSPDIVHPAAVNLAACVDALVPQLLRRALDILYPDVCGVQHQIPASAMQTRHKTAMCRRVLAVNRTLESAALPKNFASSPHCAPLRRGRLE